MAKLDISSLTAFQQKLKAGAGKERIAEFFEQCCKELALRFLRKVIKRTPVGEGTFEAIYQEGKQVRYKRGNNAGMPKLRRLTNGGTLRRGWTHGMGTMSYVASLKIKKTGNNHVITMTNPVHYARYVEYGHRQKAGQYVPVLGKSLKQSWIPGQFMMTISASELSVDMPGILDKKLKAYLEELFEDEKH